MSHPTHRFYSQCGEDKLLYERFFKDVRNGVYFEAGALNGVRYSNTLFFEQTMGWQGILVEPHPVQYKILLQTRGQKNLCLNHLISDETSPVEFIYSDVDHAAVSAVTATVPQSHYQDYYQHVETKTIKLEPYGLDEILEGVIGINLFVLDVEGHEMNALRSFSWEVPIQVAMIENLDTSNHSIRDLMTSKGFILDGVFKQNEIYYHPDFVEQVEARRAHLRGLSNDK